MANRFRTMKYFSKLAVLIDVLGEEEDIPDSLKPDLEMAAKLCKCLQVAARDLFREIGELRQELAEAEYLDSETNEPRDNGPAVRSLSRELSNAAKRARDQEDREFRRVEQIRKQKRRNEKGAN